MSQFLLAGTRPASIGEVPLAVAARDVLAQAEWHGWLRRWGLLLAFGLPQDLVGQPRACLLIQATGDQAAARLAAGWERVSGYQVTVLQLSGATAGEDRAR